MGTWEMNSDVMTVGDEAWIGFGEAGLDMMSDKTRCRAGMSSIP